MFDVKPVLCAPGSTIVVPWGKSIIYNLKSFVRIPDNTGSLSAWLDFGDGGTANINNLADPVASYLYKSPGGYTFRIQLDADGEITTYRWDVQATLDATTVDNDNPAQLSYLSAIQATLVLRDGSLRQVILPLPKTSAVASGSYYGDWGPGTAITPTMGKFKEALSNMTYRMQRSYAYGFGRLPMPRASVERAVYLHVPKDTLAYGTSAELQTDLTMVESDLREFADDPSRGSALSSLKTDIDTIFSLYSSDLTSLTRLNVLGGNNLFPADRSIRLGDVVDWREYVTQAVDENSTIANLKVWEWRRLRGEFRNALPAFDATSAWFWLAAQAVMQALSTFYEVIGQPGGEARARSMFTFNPQGGVCSVRFYDDLLRFWAHVTVGPTGSATGKLTTEDQLLDGSAGGSRGSGFVAGRAAGLINLSGSGVAAHAFDLRRVQSALDVAARTRWPALSASFAEVRNLDQETGLAATNELAPDGSMRLYASDANNGTVFLDRIALALPGIKDGYDGLEPHAFYYAVMDEVVQKPGRGR